MSSRQLPWPSCCAWFVALVVSAPLAAAQPASRPGEATDNAPLTMPDRFVTGRAPVEPKVVVIGADQVRLPGLAKRLRAELAALGLEAVDVPARATSLHGRLAELGAQTVSQRAVAALRVEHQAGGSPRVTLWLYDALTGKMLFREAALKRTAAASPEAGVSLQVVELMHASLLELNLPRQRARLRARPLPAPVADVVRPLARKGLCPPAARRRSFVLEAGPALASGIDGPGVALGVSLGASWQGLRWLAIGAEAFFPLSAAEVTTADGGRSHSAPLMVRGMLRLEPWRAARLSFAFGAGLGALVSYASGESDARYLGQTDWGTVPAAAFALQARLRLSRRLRLVASGGADVALYPLRVRVGGEQQARVGPVVLAGSLALAAAFGTSD